MPLNLGLVEALLKEQEEAQTAAHSCQSQITCLVKEQTQHQRLQQSTGSTGQCKKTQGQFHTAVKRTK